MKLAQNQYTHLLSERPKFHAQFPTANSIISKAENYALHDDVLKWFMHNVKPGSKTLETGCGYSSVVFSIIQAKHVVISPFAEEHEAIKQWCSANGIANDKTRFISRPSEEVLPGFDVGDLDLVLVDGDHAFPIPFIDWFYTANQLRQGGRMIIDDTQLITGSLLREFMRMEEGRWNLEAEIGKTSIFVKVAVGNVAGSLSWESQPFCARRTRSTVRKIRRRLSKLLAHSEDAIFCE